ncbi:hypothetical protein CPB86DRAFT_783959 [Serendipita vermifera]|nr:hypothetical protein CPB86DRAFT_783959 [Serendipita vermifera]
MSNPEFDDLRRQFATVLRASAASLRSAAIAVEQYANIIESGGIPSSHDIRQISSQLPQISTLMGMGNMMGFPSGQEGHGSGKAEGKKKKGAAGDSMITDNISPVGEDGDTKKRKRGPKKPRDPNAPKRPPSAYLIFQNEVRREIKEKNPDMNNNEVLGEVAKLWGQLTVEEKKPYNDATELAKMEYEKAKAEYEAAQGGGAAVTAAAAHVDHESDESDDDAPKAIVIPADKPSKVKVVSKEVSSKDKEKKKDKDDKKKDDKKEKDRLKKDKARPSAVSVASKVVVGSSTESSEEEEEDVIFKKRQSIASKKKAATSDSEDNSGSEDESEEEPPKKRVKGNKEEAPPVISSKKDKPKKK